MLLSLLLYRGSLEKPVCLLLYLFPRGKALFNDLSINLLLLAERATLRSKHLFCMLLDLLYS
jgi:hypothetical protein